MPRAALRQVARPGLGDPTARTGFRAEDPSPRAVGKRLTSGPLSAMITSATQTLNCRGWWCAASGAAKGFDHHLHPGGRRLDRAACWSSGSGAAGPRRPGARPIRRGLAGWRSGLRASTSHKRSPPSSGRTGALGRALDGDVARGGNRHSVAKDDVGGGERATGGGLGVGVGALAGCGAVGWVSVVPSLGGAGVRGWPAARPAAVSTRETPRAGRPSSGDRAGVGENARQTNPLSG